MNEQWAREVDWTTISFDDLIKMPIQIRVVIAQRIIASGVLNRTMVSVDGWGQFDSLPEMNYEEARRRARQIASVMTIEELVGQMSPNTTVTEYIPACLKYNDKPYVAGENLQLNIPGIRFSDGPTGVVLGSASTCFPVSMARAATWDPDLEERIGEAMGMEAGAQGANLFGGVCVNLLRHPAWGRAQETYGEDPTLLKVMGTALIRGVQRHVMACVKHYALNSMENGRYSVNVSIDERSLRELYLPHFKACVDAHVAAFMTSYNKVRGSYCGENAYLVNDILKKEWGFKGMVISDFIFGFYDTVKAALAGMDVEMPLAGRYGQRLIQAVYDGKVPKSIVEEAAVRILATKIHYSKIGRASNYDISEVAGEAHVKLALEAALRSAILLRNEGNTLPLDKEHVGKLVILGELADQANIGDMKGSSHVYPPYVVTPLQGISREVSSTTEIIVGNLSTLHSMEKEISRADAVILVVGLTSDDEGEYIPHWDSGCGGDRSSLELKDEDLQLIDRVSELHDRVVVVVQGGGTIITYPWETKVGAVLLTGYPGMEGGTALASILFGAFNPCGKLPYTIPKTVDQLPTFDKDAKEVVYDYHHGYFLADKNAYDVAHHFGFGLSYTTFVCSDLELGMRAVPIEGTLTATIQVKNAGTVPGETVVQLYTGYPLSKVERHCKDLRVFTRVSLLPGESKRLSFSLSIAELAWWNEQIHDWEIEKTEYSVYVGQSSAWEDLIKDSFRVI
jgi:beta-glucosidase